MRLARVRAVRVGALSRRRVLHFDNTKAEEEEVEVKVFLSRKWKLSKYLFISFKIGSKDLRYHTIFTIFFFILFL